MKEYAEAFYKSRTWQDCRNEYARKAKHLCENCLKDGIIRAGEIVHHINPITPANIDNPEITLNPENMMLVCRDCHAKIHSGKRYRFGPNGEIIT